MQAQLAYPGTDALPVQVVEESVEISQLVQLVVHNECVSVNIQGYNRNSSPDSIDIVAIREIVPKAPCLNVECTHSPTSGGFCSGYHVPLPHINRSETLLKKTL